MLGIGNLLMSDDGVGVHAIHELRKQPRAGVLVTEVGTAILDAIPILAWADRVLVIDALHANEPPGTLYFAEFSAILQTQGRLSLHELDLSTALEMIPKTDSHPEMFVLGVQPGCLDMGLELSPPVQRVLPDVVSRANEKIKEWRDEDRISRQLNWASRERQSA